MVSAPHHVVDIADAAASTRNPVSVLGVQRQLSTSALLSTTFKSCTVIAIFHSVTVSSVASIHMSEALTGIGTTGISYILPVLKYSLLVVSVSPKNDMFGKTARTIFEKFNQILA